jgi:hypothetical protein
VVPPTCEDHVRDTTRRGAIALTTAVLLLGACADDAADTPDGDVTTDGTDTASDGATDGTEDGTPPDTGEDEGATDGTDDAGELGEDE